jgi:hypothetical protein
MVRVLIILFILTSLSGCNTNESVDKESGKCISCHKMELDANHSFECTTCHQGVEGATDKLKAHVGLVSHPAHPEHMAKSCLPCHQHIVEKTKDSLHYTLNKSTNMFRKAFGATTELNSFVDTPVRPLPENELELADNLLRHRCFKCHLYDSGQSYPSTGHGQGCAACHFPYYESSITSHAFSAPKDEQCLSCHYGNYVGFDYYGRFEHDFNTEYRTPYTTKNDYFRPYGIEYHQLSADIHQQKGLACIDCHLAGELMLQGDKPSCKGCHDTTELENKLPENVMKKDTGFVLMAQSGTEHPLPTLQHPAHFSTSENISCQACHAQWSFDDRGRQFLRLDSDEIEDFSALTVQGNYDIEHLLTNNLDYAKDELPIAMTDTLTGTSSTGIWLKAYLTRRWENIILGRDDNGQITVLRPSLDYALSWMTEDEEVPFDAIQSQAKDHGLRPYTPHTTGSAGLFYEARIQQFLARENLSNATSTDGDTSKEQ